MCTAGRAVAFMSIPYDAVKAEPLGPGEDGLAERYTVSRQGIDFVITLLFDSGAWPIFERQRNEMRESARRRCGTDGTDAFTQAHDGPRHCLEGAMASNTEVIAASFQCISCTVLMGSRIKVLARPVNVLGLGGD